MNALDIVIVIIFFVFVALGARMGSLRVGSLVLGGFVGAALVDFYAVPLSAYFGHFKGALVLAAALLFIGGAAALIIPGRLLARITSALLLSIVDSTFGVLTGAIVGLFFFAIFFMWILPVFPGLESRKVFQNSKLVRPLEKAIDFVFSGRPFQEVSPNLIVQEQVVDKLEPLAEEVGDKIKDLGKDLNKELKKKTSR